MVERLPLILAPVPSGGLHSFGSPPPRMSRLSLAKGKIQTSPPRRIIDSATDAVAPRRLPHSCGNGSEDSTLNDLCRLGTAWPPADNLSRTDARLRQAQAASSVGCSGAVGSSTSGTDRTAAEVSQRPLLCCSMNCWGRGLPGNLECGTPYTYIVSAIAWASCATRQSPCCWSSAMINAGHAARLRTAVGAGTTQPRRSADRRGTPQRVARHPECLQGAFLGPCRSATERANGGNTGSSCPRPSNSPRRCPGLVALRRSSAASALDWMVSAASAGRGQ